MTATARATPAVIERQAIAHLSSIRVTGTLTHDAELATSMGGEPHAFLTLHFQPPRGLPYIARMDLGTDPLDQMRAQGELPYLRAGALVSLAADAVELRTDHGHAALRLVNARALVIPIDHIRPHPTTGGASHVR